MKELLPITAPDFGPSNLKSADFLFIHSSLEITLSFSPLPYAKRLRFAEHINIHTVSAHVTETPFFVFHSMYA